MRPQGNTTAKLLAGLEWLVRGPSSSALIVSGQSTLNRGKRPRDFQRSRVYRWERAHVHNAQDNPTLSLAACRALVYDVYLALDKPKAGTRWSPPQVTDGRGRRHACGSREVIKLPRWARKRTIVLHECAHGMSSDGHGPQFMARYIQLLAEFAGMEAGQLRALADAARVKVA